MNREVNGAAVRRVDTSPLRKPYNMKNLIQHIKTVAIEDCRLFFQPFVIIARTGRRVISAISVKFKKGGVQVPKKDK